MQIAMGKNKYISRSGIDSKIDSGHFKPRFDQVSQNEMCEQTKKDILILGCKGQAAPMDLAHGLGPRTLTL